NPKADIYSLPLDLSSLQSVRQFVTEITKRETKVDILINNAGIACDTEQQTEDGFEMAFGTNHLGHYLLTLSVLPLLRNAPKARIISVSAGSHVFGKINFENINLRNGAFNTKDAVSQSKLANVLFTRELARRLGRDTTVTAYSLHPGLVRTEFHRNLQSPALRTLVRLICQLFGLSIESGSQTSLYCALEEKLDNESGFYYDNCRRVDAMVSTATDDKSAQQLWQLSEELVRLEDHLKFSKRINDGIIPGLLTGLPKGVFDYTKEYSPKLNQIYRQYLTDTVFAGNCTPETVGNVADITDRDIKVSIEAAIQGVNSQRQMDSQLVADNPYLGNFSHFITDANYKTKFNELVTRNLAQIKCLSKYDTVMKLPGIRAPGVVYTDNGQFCDLQYSQSLGIQCNPTYKYRRIDGKCNNERQTNWGAAFHTMRRLLPPAFADGVNAERQRAADGRQPLPNERLISNQLSAPPTQTVLNLRRRSSAHMIWGQVIAHDTIKTLQYFGDDLPCCPPSQHPECPSVYTPLPSDQLLQAYNQTCIVNSRSMAGNTCRLGARDQITATTPVMDLSELYGFFNARARSVRTFSGGKLQTNKSLKGDDIMPEAILPRDQDMFDLNQCTPPADRPWLGCLKGGDGNRVNQQVVINTMVTTLLLRHNQHCDGLALINQHWTDEILYQEARRLLLAEYAQITYAEYLPSFSEYNPAVSADTVQEYGLAAFRFGHSNINSQFPVLNGDPLNSSSFLLRFNFEQMSQLWDGNRRGILKGLCEKHEKVTELHYVDDVRNYFFFDPSQPSVSDLFGRDIFRARDHGLAPYVYYVQYCTGRHIKRWSDLQPLIPIAILNELRDVYKDFRDIDLIVGGLAETVMESSTLGPTLACISGGIIPGLLTGSPKGGFDYTKEYSPELSQIYGQYLTDTVFVSNCTPETVGNIADITDRDIRVAIEAAIQGVNSQRQMDRQFVAQIPYLGNFSHFITEANYKTKFNELVTKNLAQIKCLSKYDTVMNLPGLQAQGVVDTDNDHYCDLQYSQSPGIRCNPSYKYRRFDGKCNNERQTNWGAAFHTMRRLLPPAFADGVNAERRRAIDGRQPLPNERFISNQLSATRPQIDQKDKLVRSSTHMIWGQMIAHDTIKALQYFGGALPCCPPSQHPECPSVYTPVPSDQLLLVYNQTCIAYSRSVAGNTCRLGARDQITATTPVMDLSDLYGPWLGCLKGGDGNRVNQQVVINTMLTTMLLRHNQHCDGLALINQHWTDEILYQEARRLLLAEYAQITYAEYLPSTFNQKFMDFFDLNVRPRGKFSEYNPDVSPDTMQEYGIAAFRFGHSNINAMFPVLNGNPLNSSSFLLRFNFEQMSQLWDGNRKGIIKGLCENFEKVTEFHYVDDVRDYVFFDPAHPRVDDLFNRDIFRARDHGLAPYVYYVQYCTGHPIKRWSDLQPLIPIDILNQLRDVYKDFRDIDLIVGGLAETVMEGSTLGPTLACINGIQFYHFKFGDRFFYEHSSQAGSFTIAQLDNIKSRASLANLLCKTSGFNVMQLHAMYTPTNDNPRIPCDHFPDIDYRLWSEGVDDCDDSCKTSRINSAIPACWRRKRLAVFPLDCERIMKCLEVFVFLWQTRHVSINYGIIPELLTRHQKEGFDYIKEYSPELNKIYGQYLTDTVFVGNCTPETVGNITDITDRDIRVAIEVAIQGVNSQRQMDRQLVADNPYLGNFSHFITNANYKTKFNELVTRNLAQIKCLTKYDTIINLPDVRVPGVVDTDGQFCELQYSQSFGIQCNPTYKYRRIDGKCNNERQTNWGAAFHTMRRLLPPAFADGVNAERRRAIDGRQPLPNERLISNQLSAPHRHTVPHDRRRSSMHMIWGQVMAHDTIKSLQYFGDELPCCRISQHPECPSVYTPIPSDPLLQAYNQTCIVDSRSMAGNTCRLGARDQITATTPVMDLSQLYGFFDARARSLRTFSKGKLQTNKSLKGDDIMPEAILPRDQDILDLNRCTPPVDRPWLGCMKGGDGNRVNQQVVVTSMLTTLLLRHNQHCDGLALINQHWTDEILYQEARRLLLAEYAQITYAEYLPSIFNQKFMDFFDLNVRPYGKFSEYNPDVSPDTVQEYGAAAFRFGHSNIDSIFPVLNGHPLNSSAFRLRFNFEQMSELWDGNRRGIIKGLCEKHEKVTELHYVDDVRNYVVFNPSEPSVTDLFHRDIFRARDHGLAPYVYYVQYCTGRHIKRWSDLQPLIPIDILNELRDVYK
ncbi:unnamed protein product, partial [Medioppia subpectinata]